MDFHPKQRPEYGCELVADVAREFGEVRLKVTGCSMIPAVWPGDEVVVQRRETPELRRGQIVLCRRQGKLVAHRITRVGEALLHTRGDSVVKDDAPWQASDVVGEVVQVIRNGRSVGLKQSLWQRAGASVVRRSVFWLRVTLHVGQWSHRLQRAGSREISWET